ncbi:hypothetical protein K470DRAFT_256959 [Piedraia hortae CBS 480.64]|uniref:FHA domain-containing protein n=1 Tax=Piedraia hortae CBS 480.64 TaxID=1314780 RepID=A0A6A7C1B0_9PEZI|nr:hypothetical protein K470DRAFT_256959 [Piedraia hortae CBS 480.64]
MQDGLAQVTLTELDTLKPPNHFLMCAGRKISLGRDTADAEADFSCSNRVVSRTHACIKCRTSSNFVIEDLDSLHGTQLNNQHLSPSRQYELADGDVITLGHNLPRGSVTHFPSRVQFNAAEPSSATLEAYKLKEHPFKYWSDIEFTDDDTSTPLPNHSQRNPMEIQAPHSHFTHGNKQCLHWNEGEGDNENGDGSDQPEEDSLAEQSDSEDMDDSNTVGLVKEDLDTEETNSVNSTYSPSTTQDDREFQLEYAIPDPDVNDEPTTFSDKCYELSPRWEMLDERSLYANSNMGRSQPPAEDKPRASRISISNLVAKSSSPASTEINTSELCFGEKDNDQVVEEHHPSDNRNFKRKAEKISGESELEEAQQTGTIVPPQELEMSTVLPAKKLKITRAAGCNSRCATRKTTVVGASAVLGSFGMFAFLVSPLAQAIIEWAER